MSSSAWWLGSAVGVAVGCAFLGCAPGTEAGSGDGRVNSQGGSGASSAGGTTAAGGSSAQGGASVGQGGVTFTNVGEGGTGGLAPEDSCGATTLQAEKLTETRTEVRTETRTETRTELQTQTETQIEIQTQTVTQVEPTAIYMMLDTSGSMIEQLKWNAAVDAITTFVNDPGSNGLHLGLTYFPAPIPISDCTGNGFTTPEVGWDVLGLAGDPHNQAIINSLLNHAPFGIGTPIEDALRGVIMGCQNFEAANPTIPCYALLITDGEPSNCAQDQQSLANIAAAGLTSGISTFAVGMPGANFTMLDAIATAGGTDCNGGAAGTACNASDANTFVTALAAIRDTITTTIDVEVEVEVPVQVEVQVEVQVPYDVEYQVEEEVTVPLDCEWTLPVSSTGEVVDPDKINVKLTDLSTGNETSLGRVDSIADCPNFSNAWHYDDPTNPTKLVACSEACNVVKALDAQIDILVGCETEKALAR